MGLVKDDRFDEETVKVDKWGDLDTSGTDLEIAYGIEEYYDSKLIGIGPEGMKEDETLSEFKGRIVTELKKLGVEVSKEDLSWYVDGGYDG